MIFREVEDRDLIAKARQGDVEAYNLLVSRWEKRIFNYLLRLVSNREDALDLSQETFLKAYQNLRKLDDPARFAAWLFRIQRNEFISGLRRLRPTVPVDTAIADSLSQPAHQDSGLVMREFVSAFSKLAPTQREALLREAWEEAGYGHYPICVAKTQSSFSADATLRGAPSGHVVNVREVRLAAGAEFIVMICGDIMTMPGLPKIPSANKIDLVDGKVVGLF